MPDYLGETFGWFMVVFILTVCILATFKDYLFRPKNVMCTLCHNVYMPDPFDKDKFICDDCRAERDIGV